MTARLAALLAASLLPALGWAGPAPADDCAAVPGLGCQYAPDAVKAADKPVLLVFHKGLHPKLGMKVPKAGLPASAQMTFANLRLKALSEKHGFAVLVLGSCLLGVGPAEIADAEKTLGLKPARVVLASFSGGWQGLDKTLGAVPAVEKVVMLDNFYFSASLANKVRAKVDAGAACAGYYTPANEATYMRVFKPVVRCAVERLDGGEHVTGVSRCLGSFMDGTPCL